MLPASPMTIASARNDSGPQAGRCRTGCRTPPPLDHDLDADRGQAVVCPERADVRDDVGLVVRDPARVDRAVELRRLEGRRLPEILVARRLDVVVRVEQHCRRAVGCGNLAKDDGRRVRELERFDPRDARAGESSTTRSCASCTGPGGKPGNAIDGMRPRRTRSALSSGISFATRVASGCSVSVVTTAPRRAPGSPPSARTGSRAAARRTGCTGCSPPWRARARPSRPRSSG